MQQYVDQLTTVVARLGGQGGQSMTNYGGINVFPGEGGGNPLETLWEMGES